MPFYRSLDKFARLSGAEKRLLCVSSLLVGGLRFLLRALPFRTVLRSVRRVAARGTHASRSRQRPPSAERIAWAVKAASRRLAAPGGPCLPQALALFILFRRYGHPAELQIGARKGEDGQLKAHAWVESNGRVAIGRLPDLSGYTAFPPLDL